MFAIAFKLYKNGLLTIGTVTWLLSRLPQSTIGGLTAVGGLAMGGTAALASGATALADGANALAGGATALVGGVAGLATNGLGGAANAMGGAAESLADGLAHIQLGELELAHILSREQGAAAGGNLVSDAIHATAGNTRAIAGAALQSATHPVAAIGATQTALTEGATQLAHSLGVSVLQLQSRYLYSPVGIFNQGERILDPNTYRPKLPW